jgi:hypothetical protein
MGDNRFDCGELAWEGAVELFEDDVSARSVWTKFGLYQQRRS